MNTTPKLRLLLYLGPNNELCLLAKFIYHYYYNYPDPQLSLDIQTFKVKITFN